MAAIVADKVDFLYIWMKVVSESIIINKMWKKFRPTERELQDLPEADFLKRAETCGWSIRKVITFKNYKIELYN